MSIALMTVLGKAIEALVEKHSENLKCPISHELFRDPVFCPGDGHTYERTAIEHWFERSMKSPVSGVQLNPAQMTLVPNFAVRTACDALRTGEQPKNRPVNIPNADENLRTDGGQLHWGDAEQLQEHLHELVEDDLRRFWECFARRFEREKCDVSSQLRQLKSELTAVESVYGQSDLSWIMDAQVFR